jgi:hypothetical protein
MNHAKQKLDKKQDKKGEGLFLPVVNFSLSAWLPAEQRTPWLEVLSLAHRLPKDYGKERVVSHSLHGLPKGGPMPYPKNFKD